MKRCLPVVVSRSFDLSSFFETLHFEIKKLMKLRKNVSTLFNL